MTELELIDLLLEALSMIFAIAVMTLAIVYYHDFVTSNKYHGYRKMQHTKWNERAQMRYDHKLKIAQLKAKGKQS